MTDEPCIPCDIEVRTIVVLGAEVLPDGRPSTALRRRAEHAAAVWHDSPPGTRVIACGGIGDGPVPEAVAIRDVLTAAGVDPALVVPEDRSRSTAEQAAAVAEMLRRGSTVVVVTDRYHLPRATFLMRRQGLVAIGSGSGRSGGSRTRWALGALREVPAFVKDAVMGLLRHRSQGGIR